MPWTPAVLAESSMKRIERDVRLETRKYTEDVRSDIDGGDAMAVAFQRGDYRLSRNERYLALRRPATHENRRCACS